MTQVSSIQLSSFNLSSVEFNSIQCSAALFSFVQPSSVHLSSDRFNSAQFISVQLSSLVFLVPTQRPIQKRRSALAFLSHSFDSHVLVIPDSAHLRKTQCTAGKPASFLYSVTWPCGMRGAIE